MSADRDLSALLPDVPPPLPSARDAAVEEALRRFDGLPPSAPPKPSSAWRAAWRRPQFGALVAASLVAVIAMPVWLIGEKRAIIEPASQPMTDIDVAQEAAPAPPTLVAPPPPDAVGDAQPASKASEPLAKAEAPAQAQAEQSKAQAGVVQVPVAAVGEELMAPQAPAPPPPPPPAAIVLAERAPAAGAAQPGEEDGGDVVVTATRRSGFSERQEHARAKRAAPLPDEEIAALDRAIAAAPQSAEAYYQRGLVYQRRGDKKRARADFRRAAELDPRYDR